LGDASAVIRAAKTADDATADDQLTNDKAVADAAKSADDANINDALAYTRTVIIAAQAAFNKLSADALAFVNTITTAGQAAVGGVGDAGKNFATATATQVQQTIDRFADALAAEVRADNAALTTGAAALAGVASGPAAANGPPVLTNIPRSMVVVWRRTDTPQGPQFSVAGCYADPSLETGGGDNSAPNWLVRNWGYIGGSLQMIQGVLEVSAGVAASFTPGAQGFAPLLLMHGLDQAATGLSSIVQGRTNDTLTTHAVMAITERLGATRAEGLGYGRAFDAVLGFLLNLRFIMVRRVASSPVPTAPSTPAAPPVNGANPVTVPRTDPNFSIVESGPSPRSVRFLPNDPANPGWGLTSSHLKKHFFGNKSTALRQIDPGGTGDKWAQHLAELIHSPVSGTTSNGMLDIIKSFPRADGSGTFKMGVRLAPKPDGTFDLITVLTKQ